MPDLTIYQKLLIFGGTFDPPHIGHVVQPERVREALGFDVVVYLPTGQSPHKQGKAQTDADLRMRMVQAAITGQPRAIASGLELLRPPPSYTVDTLEALKKQTKPDTQMRLLIGADQARVFDQWHQADRICELAEPVVMVRPPDDIATLKAVLPAHWHNRLIAVPAMDISATDIRQRVASSQPIDKLTPAGVALIIQEQGLYTNGA